MAHRSPDLPERARLLLELVQTGALRERVSVLPRDAGRRRTDGRRPTHDPWRLSQAAALFGICTLVMPFWACHEQMGNTLPLFFQDLTDRTMPGGALLLRPPTRVLPMIIA